MSGAVVVGGGLAGTLACLSLVDEGLDAAGITWLAPDDAQDARAIRWALFHAAAGRRFDLSGPRGEAYRAARAFLTSAAVAPFVRERSIWRPLVPGVGERLRRSLETERSALAEHGLRPVLLDVDSPLLIEDARVARLPTIAYEGAAEVALGALLARLRAALAVRGVRVVGAHAREVGSTADVAWVNDGDGRRHEAAAVVLAAGAGLRTLVPEAGLETEWGELLAIDAPALPAVMSAGAHVCSGDAGELILGATHFARGDDDVEAERGRALLLARAASFVALPHAAARVDYRGQRTFLRGDRTPVCGALPRRPRVFVLGGFGGAGLFWGPYCARLVARALVHGASIPEELAAGRARRGTHG